MLLYVLDGSRYILSNYLLTFWNWFFMLIGNDD